MIGRSIARPLGLLGDRMQALADGKLDGEIPGLGPRRRDRRDGLHRADLQGQRGPYPRPRTAEAETQARAAAERRTAMENIAGDFGAQRQTASSLGVDAGCGMQTTAQSMTATPATASARAATSARPRKFVEQCRHGRGAREKLSASVAEISRQVARSSEIASKAVGRCRAHQRHRWRASTAPKRSARWSSLIHSIAAQTIFWPQCHHRGGARRRVRPRLLAVVASEVKALANQTRRRPRKSRRQVAAMPGLHL